MMNFIKKKLKEEKGLTLIELLAVIVILAIVAAIAIPAIGNIIQNSRENAVVADAQNVLSAANLYFAEENDPDGRVTNTELEGAGYLESSGVLDSATVIDGNPDEIFFTATNIGNRDEITITETNAVTAAQLSEEGRDLFNGTTESGTGTN